ncbi:conserved protein, unknown function [Hepatocystis sp. ex Piliocolobus tephrosceles]|nr:conserved protein, unknown function [Hepatocystis sp. ex Piliocolobus tephrosceles]
MQNDTTMNLLYDQTPRQKVDSMDENCDYVKSYSYKKKRVYTPSKYDKYNVLDYEENQNYKLYDMSTMCKTPKKEMCIDTTETDTLNKKKKNNNKKDEKMNEKWDERPDNTDDNLSVKTPKKKKKKNSLYYESLYLNTTPLRKNKNIYELEKTDTYEKVTKYTKWIMDNDNINELPENIKNEYVSYLNSPLKRSERLIKTKINKMINANKKKKKNENNCKKERKHSCSVTKQEHDIISITSTTTGTTNNNYNTINNNVNKNNKKNERICSDTEEETETKTNIIECDFEPEKEEKCWDDYYTQSNDKIKPFTGISTELAVDVITDLLKPQIRKIKINNKEFLSPISENDTIMEIGHGNHPLAVHMFEKWGTVGRYIGVEFSGLASTEALKCEKLKNLYLKRKVEFIKIFSMKYYKDNFLNGIITESNISPKNTKTDFIKLNTFKYIFAKSTLDYITCRIDNIGNSCDWDEDLQISPTVVDMFNSLSDALQNKKNNNSKNNSYIIFVEPSNSSKFRDHVLTIFKVIYTATFKYNSSAKYLRLTKITNNTKACGYLIEKKNEVYQNFDQMRNDFLKLILKSSNTKNMDEIDWYLPTMAPPKWVSNSSEDIEYLVKLNGQGL